MKRITNEDVLKNIREKETMYKNLRKIIAQMIVYTMRYWGIFLRVSLKRKGEEKEALFPDNKGYK